MERERRLADALRTGQDERVGQLSSGESASKHCPCFRMTEENRILGRFRNAIQRIVLFGCNAFKHVLPRSRFAALRINLLPQNPENGGGDFLFHDIRRL